LCGAVACTVSGEWPAIWCLFSIGLLVLVVETPLRGDLHVRSWPLWPETWRSSAMSAID
jgi:hypothetical protein